MRRTGATILMRGKVDTQRSALRHLALPLVAGAFALLLAACETSSTATSEALVSPLNSAPEEQKGQVKPVAFAPVIGAPAKVSSKMNERLVAAAGKDNIPVGSSNDADYTIRGYLVASSDPKGTKLSYIWDITDKSGKRAKRFQGDELIEGKKGGDPWALVDDSAIDRIASSTTQKIAGWMSGSASPPVTTASTNPQPAASRQQPSQASAEQQPATPPASALSAQAAEPPQNAEPVQKPDSIVAVVPPVIGAPGDGQSSLTTAMRRHLRSAGVELVEGNPKNAYTVKGTVKLGSADAGQQPITIRWLVIDPAGKTMEKAVVQRNKVPAGSLDGKWGQVADLAASEAAKSVAKLIKPTG